MADEEFISKRTLLQKYEIPVEFLDFPYVRKCSDAKTLERIVKILRSGEEGYYPDLMKCAEEKLSQLKPDSKMLRVEEVVVKTESLEDGKRQQLELDMKSWISDMKKQDQLVKEIKPTNKVEQPIRKAKQIQQQQPESAERIKSTDYTKWDKFDADAAELKVDLDEERQRELVETKNLKNLEKIKLIEEIEDAEVDCLSDFEKDHLSLQYKEKGNECFKAKEYDEAIKEYTQSIRIKPTAAAFNNRGLVYLKQQQFLKAIADTNECLRIEPDNVKALLRKAQAFIGNKMDREAFDTFEKVLEIDGHNQIASHEMIALRKRVPPRNAFRMKIEEISDVSTPAEKLDCPDVAHIPKAVHNIVVEETNIFDKLLPKKVNEPEKIVMPSDKLEKKAPLIQEMN